MQHAYTTPDYPPHWDDEDADPVEYLMVFKYRDDYYRIYGPWDGEDWLEPAKAYLLDDDGNELEEVSGSEFWTAANAAALNKTYEDMEEVR